MFDNTVTRLPPGVNIHKDNATFSDMYVPDRINKIHEYSQDFDQYIAADWVQTLNGGSAALQAGDGGLLLLTTVASNFASVAKTPANFQLARGFRAWYRATLTVDALVGLTLNGALNATATPFTVGSQTDGIFFLTSNTGAVSIVVAVGAVQVVTATGVSIVAGQPATFAWYYDGGCYGQAPNGRVVWSTSVNGIITRGVVNIPASGTIAAFPGAVNISPITAVSASTAVIRTLSTDMLYLAKDRVNPNTTVI